MLAVEVFDASMADPLIMKGTHATGTRHTDLRKHTVNFGHSAEANCLLYLK